MEYLIGSINDIPFAEGEWPDRVRWGFCSLEEWSRDAVRQLAVHAQREADLVGEIEEVEEELEEASRLLRALKEAD